MPPVETVLEGVRPFHPGQILDDVVVVVVPALGQVRGAADHRESGDAELRRSVVERSLACVRKSPDSQPLDHVLIAIFLQPVEAEAAVAQAQFVDQRRPEKVRPVRDGLLGALQFVAAETRNIARGAQRI